MNDEKYSLSPREKAENTAMGRIIVSHVKEEYPQLSEYLSRNESLYDSLEELIDDGLEVFREKLHEGLNALEARDVAFNLVKDSAKDIFSKINNDFKKPEDPFDLEGNGFISSSELN